MSSLYEPQPSSARLLRYARVVLCHIQAVRHHNRTVVRLAGRLTEAEVPDLFEACARQDQPVVLELDELVSADAVGVDALFRLELQGAQLVGLPEYLRLKLDTLIRENKR